MENKLKAETNGVIKNLKECDLRVIMATGDNVLTAVSVARQCGIIDAQKRCWVAQMQTTNDGQK